MSFELQFAIARPKFGAQFYDADARFDCDIADEGFAAVDIGSRRRLGFGNSGGCRTATVAAWEVARGIAEGILAVVARFFCRHGDEELKIGVVWPLSRRYEVASQFKESVMALEATGCFWKEALALAGPGANFANVQIQEVIHVISLVQFGCFGTSHLC